MICPSESLAILRRQLRVSTASLLPRLMSPIVGFMMPSVPIDPALSITRIINILQKSRWM